MGKTTVVEDGALTALFPRHLANRVSVTLVSGEIVVSEMISGPGTVEKPMADSDFERKFRRMASPHLDELAKAKVLGYVDELQHKYDLTSMFAAMVASVRTEERRVGKECVSKGRYGGKSKN